MNLTPNSWGTETRERWSDAARKRSAEVRRAKAQARAEGAKLFDVPLHRPRPHGRWLAGATDADTQRAYNAFKAETYIGQAVSRDNVSFGTTGHLDDNVRLDYRTGAPKIQINSDQPKADALSALRHEIGHLDVGWSKRGRPYKIAGKNVSHRYAQEFAAWRAAVRDAPHNRVRWSRVETALHSYRKQDLGRDYSEDQIRRFVQRDVATLKRYGRLMRRRDTTPVGV